MSTHWEVEEWIEEIQAAAQKIALRFSRKDLRTRASQYLHGLISRVEHKNGWQLAEELGEKTPTNLQHFLLRATWNADEVRDDLQTYVVEYLGAKDGILIIDETGFLKKGTKSVGVKRQRCSFLGQARQGELKILKLVCFWRIAVMPVML